MKRRTGTLYELGREQLARSGKQTSPSGAAPGGGERPPSRSSAKLPVGLLALGGAGVLIVVLLIWWVGCSSESAAEVTAMPEPTRQTGPVAIDPLVHIDEPEEDDVADEAPIEPPTDGKWYFVLAETRPEGARRLAKYCRDQGLDAVVISGHNARLERVIALPGLDSASTTTDAYRALDERIRAVGRRWKASGGTTNLSDRYLHRKKTQP